MTKKEAINILIANAVCVSPKLHCDDDCPYYKNCIDDGIELKLEEAVKILRRNNTDEQ